MADLTCRVVHIVAKAGIVVGNRFINNVFSKTCTFTALTGYAQSISYLTKRASTAVYSASNLVVGNTFADAYVHNLLSS
ncbi:MAG: lipoate synthase [Porticoccus sp.]